jgi:hypothetical protein
MQPCSAEGVAQSLLQNTALAARVVQDDGKGSRNDAFGFDTTDILSFVPAGFLRVAPSRLLMNHSLLPLSYLPRKEAGEKIEEGSHLSCRVLRRT